MTTSPAPRASHRDGSVAVRPESHWVMDCMGGADPTNRFDPYNRHGVDQLWNTAGGRANGPGKIYSAPARIEGAAGGL